MFLLLTGCATHPIVQIDGRNVPDNVIRARTLTSDLTITYKFVKMFDVKEGKESYESWEFLPLVSADILKLKDVKKMIVDIDIFNPLKNEYTITKHLTIEGGEEVSEKLYNGSLSRKNLTIELPLEESKLVSFYYDAYNKNGDLVFMSFKVQYIITGG